MFVGKLAFSVRCPKTRILTATEGLAKAATEGKEDLPGLERKKENCKYLQIMKIRNKWIE